LARAFYAQMRSPRQDLVARREILGRRLSEMLLAPAASELRSRRLVIVPQGALQAISWAALLEPGPALAPGNGTYLVERHEIVLLPSLGTLDALRRGPRRSPGGPLAVFADPVYQPDDPRFQVSVEAAKSSWERLAHTGAEAESILRVAASQENRLELGFDASRETLEKEDWSRFSTLHFATHAESRLDHPELSGLVLSLFDRLGRARDGHLRGFAITRLRFDADLVVLSACETGVGEDLAGEGMASLARFFFEAGARSVVSSLWRVSDRSTAQLMERFYRAYLGRGLSPAAALARAQRELLAQPETSSPYRWAGFVVQGDAWDSP
jgi:CHAT domain-containing protein